MLCILSSIMFIKSASGSHTVTGVAVCRIDEQEYVEVNYKAFRMNTSNDKHTHVVGAREISDRINAFVCEQTVRAQHLKWDDRSDN